MKYYEDIRIGDRTDLGSHTFTAEEIKAFAVRYDPQPFHVDEAAAAATPYGCLIASGWHTAAVGMRQVIAAAQREQEAQRARGEPIAGRGPSPGLRDVRWHKPVFPGDTITYAAEVKELRVVKRPGWGLMTSYQTGTNQHGELVYSVTGMVFVERKPAS